MSENNDVINKFSNRDDIIKKFLDLKSEIDYHNKKYYEDDDPEIEDWEYDKLKRELEELRNMFPNLLSIDDEIGGFPSEKFSHVNHKVRMESLHDSFSYDELEKFYKRISDGNEKFVVEPKIDGISLSVEYENGILTRASTRGDGYIGEDITENALTITNLPHKISRDIEYLEVRGECFISKLDFANLIKYQDENKQKIFKNPRNAVAGSIRQKDSSKCKERNLKILFFNIQQIKDKTFENHSESLNFLSNVGLPVVDFKIVKNFDEIINEIKRIGNSRNDYEFQIDGAVLKIDSLQKREHLGSTSSFPRWAEAFKYPPECKKTKLLRIDLSIGRTGVITPVAVIEPVYIGGSLVSKASLHNQEFIKSKNIHINDTVSIVKSGDIIPEIIKSESNENSEDFKMPEFCPSCKKKLKIEQSDCGIAFKCENSECPSKIKSQILHFASKDAMNIEGFGEECFNVIKDELKDYSDIYNLDENILKKYKEFQRSGVSNSQEIFPGFNSKLYLNKIGKNLLNSIDKSKKNSLEKLIYGIGIPFVGKEASKIISHHFKNIDNIIKCSLEELLKIDGIGDITAKSILDFFNDKTNINKLNKLKLHGLNTECKISKSLKNKSIFVITGKFEKYSRNDIIDIIENIGGTVSSSVSKKTNFLICGTDPGKKFLNAQNLNVKIIYENDFDDFINANK